MIGPSPNLEDQGLFFVRFLALNPSGEVEPTRDVPASIALRESSFCMTRGGDEDIEGGSENLYTSKPTGGGRGS